MGCGGSRLSHHHNNGTTLNSPHSIDSASKHQRKRSDTMDTGGRPQQWETLRNTYDIVDPADVQATIDEWMDTIIRNHLSGTYVTFLLRKLRQVKPAPTKSAVVFSKQPTLKSPHITTAILKRILPNSEMQENIIHLMMALGDRSLIDSQANALAKLEPPVTVQKIQGICNRWSNSERADTTTLHAVTTILALAHGTRTQKLQLLFYACLEQLPSDCFPAYLIEPQDKALTLQSLLHYHYHGTLQRNFVPSPSKLPVRAQGKFLKVTTPPPMEEQQQKDEDGGNSAVMQAIYQGDPDPNLLLDIPGEFTIAEFFAFAKEHWDNETLDHIMYRFFGQGIFPTAKLEQALVYGTTEQPYNVFGGLGNYDGLGGLGAGVLYVIPKRWWDQWNLYITRKQSKRPPPLDTDELLASGTGVVRGVCGSYEFMKHGLVQGRDFCLVPPMVWDRLYELYAGGPPLPRMVIPGSELTSQALPVLSKVILHPWIIQIILCDPVQPYRRGETGSMSIRVMVMPAQPLWRVMGEIMCRFPQAQNAARLWKRVTVENGTIMSRYGPYRLLCKNREAMVPTEETMEEAVASWKEYTANETVEGTGLVDGDILLLEYSIFNKNGELTWPRKAAAEDGRQRRLAEEDHRFRQMLQGLDEKGNTLLKPTQLVGMEVDAQDRSDRWYTVKIEEVRIFDSDDTDYEEEAGEDEEVTDEPVARKKVKVNFPGGHFDWIDVNNTDRLTLAGRMSSEREESVSDKKDPASSPTANGHSNGRSRSTASNGRANSNAADNGNEYQKASPLPGFGATGLTNLGNTCYMNSAVQCMAYLPLLRAYLLSAQYKTMGDLNKDNPLGTGGRLLEEFAELLRGMWSAKVAEKSPNKFKLQLGKNNSQFSGADQQDAQEFLNYIIDILHEDSNRVEKKPYVENLEDDWVARTDLRVVGEETWKRFLRRNRSIMADVAMGQTLNTVSCPHCHYESRSFDPFNLLSIPLPAVAEAVFQCKLIRRATPRNCPWVVNRPRKHEKGPLRYNIRPVDTTSGAPSEAFIAETYVISLSRLADCGDLKLQLQNLSGIPVRCLRVCRSEEFIMSEAASDKSCLKTLTKVVPLADKDPAAGQAKKRNGNDDVPKGPTQIIAFETTMNPRRLQDIDDSEKSVKAEGDERYPSSREKALIDLHLNAYCDDKEGRIVDTDPIVIAKAVSRSLWPRNAKELKVGLRVDAQDHTGKFLPGRIVLIKEETVEGQDTDTGAVETIFVQRKVQVHFDNFLSRWDEEYAFDSFQKQKILPIFSKTEAKNKVSEFMVSHRYTDRKSRQVSYFGLSFLIQVKTEWSTARAGAHILLQASRFLYKSSQGHEAQHLADKVHSYVSDLIDTLLEKDKDFIQHCLGLSSPTFEGNGDRPYRYPSFDSEAFATAANKKISDFMKKLPFELIVCTELDSGNKKAPTEKTYSFAVDDTVGNFINSNNTLILSWREPSASNKSDFKRIDPILYNHPKIHQHAASADVLDTFVKGQESNGGDEPSQDGLDLAYCLTNYCKEQKLLLSDNWTCPKCKKAREAPQKLTLWRLPDLLTFHIKRFNMSARWHEKILTKVNFPMTGLDMSEWCHDGSPARDDQNVYDLIGVMNHYGSMTGGHYIATCKATLSGKDGKEEVAYGFNGRGINVPDEDATADEPSHWVLGRGKAKSSNRADSALSAKAAATTAEPIWLQFDDEIVEQIPPRHIVSEMAYVLFYRKRALDPSNIARYSTIE